jgi:hypothetical protein
MLSVTIRVGEDRQEAGNSLLTIASWRTFQVESVEVTEETGKNKDKEKKKNLSNTMNTTIWEAGIDSGPSPIQ